MLIAVKVALSVWTMLAALAFAADAAAQNPQPVCVPGTAICATSDGRGGVQVNGNAQAGPGGVNATGQATGYGDGNANANARANARGNAGATGGGSFRSRGRRGYDGRFGVGVAPCPVFRAGVWSGYKFGGCFALSFRFEALTFEMETQLLYGGTTHAFDWTFPMSFLIPLANERSLFDGPYLRFGGSPIGATFARARDGGNFVRFGLFAGAGYELLLGDRVSWRVFDVRAGLDMGTKRAMDRLGNWLDLGAQVSTAIVF